MPNRTDTFKPLRARGTPAPRGGLRPLKPTPSECGRVKLDGKYFARDGRRFRAHGVTYGPFEPGPDGHQFPSLERARQDFTAMRDAGVNAVRTYHVPPAWLFDLAGESGLHLFVDVPWRKHLCFLDDADARAEARAAVRAAAERGRGHQSLFAYSVGNEIPTDVIRWHGARRVERFVAELADVARQT